MLPLHDNIPTRRTPVVTVALILANVAVFVFYELPDLNGAVAQLAFRPCEVEGSCRAIGAGWPVTAFSSMFMHAGWSHLLGNMLFLWIFGNNVEDALGRVRFVAFYLAAGLAATALQSFVTLHWGSAVAARVPSLGASGAIAGVLGAYLLLHPGALVLTWIAPIFFLPIPAVFYLGIWFAYQALDGTLSFTQPERGGGVAYFAHVGGFVFGFLAIRLFLVGRGGRRSRPVLR